MITKKRKKFKAKVNEILKIFGRCDTITCVTKICACGLVDRATERKRSCREARSEASTGPTSCSMF